MTTSTSIYIGCGYFWPPLKRNCIASIFRLHLKVYCLFLPQNNNCDLVSLSPRCSLSLVSIRPEKRGTLKITRYCYIGKWNYLMGIDVRRKKNQKKTHVFPRFYNKNASPLPLLFCRFSLIGCLLLA